MGGFGPVARASAHATGVLTAFTRFDSPSRRRGFPPARLLDHRRPSTPSGEELIRVFAERLFREAPHHVDASKRKGPSLGGAFEKLSIRATCLSPGPSRAKYIRR